MFVLMIIVSWWLSLVIHEYGHALVLLAYRQNVTDIYFGANFRPKLTLPVKVRGINVKLHFSPYCWSGENVWAWPIDKKPKTSILVLTYLAGPVANLAVFAIIYIYNGSLGIVAFFTTDHIGSITFWEWLSLLSLAGFLEILPFTPKSDGGQLLKIAMGKEL